MWVVVEMTGITGAVRGYRLNVISEPENSAWKKSERSLP